MLGFVREVKVSGCDSVGSMGVDVSAGAACGAGGIFSSGFFRFML